jgi:hypothetical protein
MPQLERWLLFVACWACDPPRVWVDQYGWTRIQGTTCAAALSPFGVRSGPPGPIVQRAIQEWRVWHTALELYSRRLLRSDPPTTN